MSDAPYTVRVANAMSETGEMLVDPFKAAGVFRGVVENDIRPREICEVTPGSAEEVSLRFSEPVTGGAGPGRRQVRPADICTVN